MKIRLITQVRLEIQVTLLTDCFLPSDRSLTSHHFCHRSALSLIAQK
jgi:hypothetical protein